MREEQILDELIDEVIAGRPLREADPLAGVAGQLLCLNELRPRPEAKAASRYLMLELAAKAAAPAPTRASRLRRRLTAVVASGMALTMATSGTVYAASNSLPGDTLFPVKEVTENVRLAFVPSGQARAEAQVRLARIRLAEIKELMKRQDKRRIGLAVAALNRRLALARSEDGLSLVEARRIKSAADSLGRSSVRWLAPASRRRVKSKLAPVVPGKIQVPPLDTSKQRPEQVDQPALPAPKRPAATPSPQIVKPSRPVIDAIRARVRTRPSK